MGLIFNRAGTGLTDTGDPMTDQELAIMLSAMGSGGGGLSKASKGLFARLAMKNKASARSRITKEAVDSLKKEQPPQAMMRPQGGPMAGGNRAPGGGFSLGLGQGGGQELAQLMMMMKKKMAGGGGMMPGGPPRGGPPQGGMPPGGPPPGAGGPPPGGGMMGPMRSGSPGGASSQAPFVAGPGPGALRGPGAAGSPMPSSPAIAAAEKTLDPSLSSSPKSLQGSPAQRVSKFYETTPQKLETIKLMLASGDPALRDIGRSWMTAVISGPKPKDRYMTVGNNLYDVYTQSWIMAKKPPGMKIDKLSEGYNVISMTDEQGNVRRHTVFVPPGEDWQIREALHTENSESGESVSKLVRVNTETGLAEDLFYADGSHVLSDTNVDVTADKITSGARTKWLDQYSAAKLSLRQLKSLEPIKEAIMKSLTFGGKITLAWGDIISRLGVSPGPEFAEMTSGLAKAQHVANLYIKTITGAQMSEREADRLLKAIPSPRDSPERWLAKLEAAIELSQMAMDHYEELLDAYGQENIGRARKEAHEYSEKLVDDFVAQAEKEAGFGAGVKLVN